MAIQFIFGRSGFGKTWHCFREITDCLLEDSDQSLLLLVPAQATYQAEKAILNDNRISGYNRLRVLSFERLAYLLYSSNIAARQISPIGQEMIVHRILRQNAGKLSVFGSSATQPGLAGEVTRTIIELQRYCQNPEDIDKLLKTFEKEGLEYIIDTTVDGGKVAVNLLIQMLNLAWYGRKLLILTLLKGQNCGLMALQALRSRNFRYWRNC